MDTGDQRRHRRICAPHGIRGFDAEHRLYHCQRCARAAAGGILHHDHARLPQEAARVAAGPARSSMGAVCGRRARRPDAGDCRRRTHWHRDCADGEDVRDARDRRQPQCRRRGGRRSSSGRSVSSDRVASCAARGAQSRPDHATYARD